MYQCNTAVDWKLEMTKLFNKCNDKVRFFFVSHKRNERVPYNDDQKFILVRFFVFTMEWRPSNLNLSITLAVKENIIYMFNISLICIFSHILSMIFIFIYLRSFILDTIYYTRYCGDGITYFSFFKLELHFDIWMMHLNCCLVNCRC